MADLEQPLLLPKKKTYPKCPGCKVAHLSADGAPPSYKELSLVAVMMLANALPISFMYPFLYFMVRDMHITARDEDIGYYAGYIGSAFMIGRWLTSMYWGVIADKYGRKPVMLIGVASVIVFNIIFGFSTSFWPAFLTRLLLGAFNGILGPVKAYASEICSDEHQPLGVAVVGTTLGLGMIIGPATGGYLAQPNEKYPSLFPPGSLFDRYPYLMPCLFVAGLAVVGLFITIWYLPETLHIHKDSEVDGYTEKSGLVDKAEESESTKRKDDDSIFAVFKNRPLVSAVLVYCTWSMHNMAYTEIFALWAVSPLKNGGLAFTTTDVGNVLAISGAGCLLFQLLAFPPIARRLGPIFTTRYSALLSLPLLVVYPFMQYMHGAVLWLILTFVSVSKSSLGVATLSGSFLLINNSVVPRNRGRANGLSVSAVSFFKAIGPGAGGAIFAWAQSRHSAILPGNQMVFFMLGLVALADVFLTYEPFLPKIVDKPKHEDDERIALPSSSMNGHGSGKPV